MKTLIVNYLDYALAALLAGLGGAIRLMYRRGKRPTLLRVAAEIAIAGFAGTLVNALMIEFDAGSGLKIVTVSIAGYAAREVIELARTAAVGIIKGMLKRALPGSGKDAEEEDGEEGETKEGKK